MRHLNNGTDHRHSKSCCDQSSPARRTTRGVSMWFECLLDLREACPASHPLTLAECRWLGHVSPLTQASWSLASCGQGLFITSLSGGQLSQTPMVLACSSVMGSWWVPAVHIIKTHVHGFFDTDLHQVSWHFATHEAVRPNKISVENPFKMGFCFYPTLKMPIGHHRGCLNNPIFSN